MIEEVKAILESPNSQSGEDQINSRDRLKQYGQHLEHLGIYPSIHGEKLERGERLNSIESAEYGAGILLLISEIPIESQASVRHLLQEFDANRNQAAYTFLFDSLYNLPPRLRNFLLVHKGINLVSQILDIPSRLVLKKP